MVILAGLEAFLGRSWGDLGASCGDLGASWGDLGCLLGGKVALAQAGAGIREAAGGGSMFGTRAGKSQGGRSWSVAGPPPSPKAFS